MRDAPPAPCLRHETPPDAPIAAADAHPSAPLPRQGHGEAAATPDRAPSPFDRARLGWGWLANDGGGDSRPGERTD